MAQPSPIEGTRGTRSKPQAPYDPRSVANLLLHEAARLDITITHLTIQRLLYFAHGLSLTRSGQPLVLGYFEAWRLGSVHPLIYAAFKPAGGAPIDVKARAQNIMLSMMLGLSGQAKPARLSPPPKPRG